MEVTSSRDEIDDTDKKLKEYQQVKITLAGAEGFLTRKSIEEDAEFAQGSSFITEVGNHAQILPDIK